MMILRVSTVGGIVQANKIKMTIEVDVGTVTPTKIGGSTTKTSKRIKDRDREGNRNDPTKMISMRGDSQSKET